MTNKKNLKICVFVLEVAIMHGEEVTQYLNMTKKKMLCCRVMVQEYSNAKIKIASEMPVPHSLGKYLNKIL